MTKEKLPSGNWRIKQMIDGKVYRVTVDHKPTNAEANELIRMKVIMSGNNPNGDMTFQEAARAYVEMKRNVLSPNTVREYLQTCARMSEWFCKMKIDDINQIAINKQINELAVNRSPKTVRNYHGFISAILGTFRPDMKIYTTLPQKTKYELNLPSDEDVLRLVAYMKTTDYYAAVCLAVMGLRRGEILALTPDDFEIGEEGPIVHVNKAVAIDENRNIVIKAPKTTKSIRDLDVDQYLYDRIKSQGFVYKGCPTQITDAISAAQKKLGMKHFSLHKLRHYFAAKGLTITNIQTVMEMGGWSSPQTVQNIYAYSIEEEKKKARKAAAEVFGSIFSQARG